MPHIAPFAERAPRTVMTSDLVRGGGAKAEPGLWASIHYVIASSRGRQLDASWGSGETFRVRLGAGMVLRGWEGGMLGMRVGGRREIVIPPALGYGAAGHPPDVKPNEALIVIVDLLGLSKTDPLARGSALSGAGG